MENFQIEYNITLTKTRMRANKKVRGTCTNMQQGQLIVARNQINKMTLTARRNNKLIRNTAQITTDKTKCKTIVTINKEVGTNKVEFPWSEGTHKVRMTVMNYYAEIRYIPTKETLLTSTTARTRTEEKIITFMIQEAQ